jgi:hypothetical protein
MNYLQEVVEPGLWDPEDEMRGLRVALAWRGLRFALRSTGHLPEAGSPIMQLSRDTWSREPLDFPMEQRPFESIKHEYAAGYLLDAGSIYPLRKWLPRTLKLLGVPDSAARITDAMERSSPNEEPEPAEIMQFEENLSTDYCAKIAKVQEDKIFEELRNTLGVSYLDFRDHLELVRNMLIALRPVNLEAERVATMAQLEQVFQTAALTADTSTMLRAIKQRADLMRPQTDNLDPFEDKLYAKLPAKPPAKLIEEIKKKHVPKPT